jgi:hypothetical protein
MRAVASALCKLMDAKPKPFNDAFDQLGERMLLCFMIYEGEIARIYFGAV